MEQRHTHTHPPLPCPSHSHAVHPGPHLEGFAVFKMSTYMRPGRARDPPEDAGGTAALFMNRAPEENMGTPGGALAGPESREGAPTPPPDPGSELRASRWAGVPSAGNTNPGWSVPELGGLEAPLALPAGEGRAEGKP